MNAIKIDHLIHKCQTGDLILYSSNNWISNIIEYFTGSKFSHVAMIIKDPTYINPDLAGIFLLESGSESIPDPENHKFKYGVQLTPIGEVIDQYKDGAMGKLYYRQLDCLRSNNFINKIKDIHHQVHNKPYDLNIIDWLKAALKIKIGDEHKTNESWCSALITYVYSQLGFLNPDIKWTVVSPNEFSQVEDPSDLKFSNCILHREKIVEFTV